MLIFAKPVYTYTITGETDDDYRKFLSRKIRESMIESSDHPLPEGTPLDISLDDDIGDVVAGIAARTTHDTLYIELLWVSHPLRKQGLGRRLVEMAEEIAVKRGCSRVRVCCTDVVTFYEGLGYNVTGKLQQFPAGNTRYWLTKTLVDDGAKQWTPSA